MKIKLNFICLAFLILSTALYSNAGASDKTKTKAKKKKPALGKIIPTQNVHFERWKEVQEFKFMMTDRYNFDADEFDRIIKEARFVDTAIELMKPMPAGKPKNWSVYRSRFVETARIEAGLRFWERNLTNLTKAEAEFGVAAEIIVGLIGVETIYGKNMGKFRAIDAITTLAFSYPDTSNKKPKTAFFKNELVQLLLWARDTKTDPLNVKASYAGAIGLCQFMPSSMRSYAIDFDQNGKIELRDSEADAIGSVANYLSKHGWKKDLPYVFPASVNQNQQRTELPTKQINELLNQGLRASYSLESLKPLITTPVTDAPTNILYGVVDLQNGDSPTEYWLGTENFFAITQYNRSYFYAMSVIELGQSISLARRKN